ncbi:PREDICTED: myeloid differentiation primary response protein MyD88 [Vollenhovia emeryi]|uniref:myeloid differentiation primary response protein MyD88 n=1 Tax=Vollenhovia emeryi TaxID=411798 RepID=UPI0005F4628B|nr:PREDICTED: myeloid differentiation primary response protein MyD88 [Vollenhovia emeryi]XP_011860480.1 PREDICTED: myeloid differentiation primary response protein MyD88 [Vollenhovia emeryi]XP_011860481.1 PREDICTED: myeloid differentiation primary response protein MyD88 [Vollenhovia emeryi]XP_011860482.1 PREDICTED: myeloid differentiation primary response protein MyD88 [Vollenhovia emeryi]
MTIDLSTVPLIAATVTSRQAIATMLNPQTILLSDSGMLRDWRGLADQLEFSADVMSLLMTHSNPTNHMLTLLEKSKKDVTIKRFQTIMEQMDRWDVIDDTEALFQSDAKRYLEHQQRAQESADPIDKCADEEILTSGDIHRLRKGLKTQYYDAFLLYAEEDIDFVNVIIEKLETQSNLKLCLKDRDLVAGIEFEQEAIMKLISERCNRLLVIVSPSFLKSSANKFFLNYTQALSIEKRQRKIIPCIYKSCELPIQLKYIFHLDYNRRGLYDFWGKLRDSIQSAVATSSSTQMGNSSTIQETTEVKKILSDKCSDISYISEKANEALKYPEQKDANCHSEIIAESSDIKAANISGKKNKTFLRWEKITSKWKTKQTKQTDELNTETIVQKLPSLDNLDSLNLSDTHIHRKKKKNLLNKFMKKKTALKT